jgi:hypothetical protein
MENTTLLQDQVITITITMIMKMITKLITKMITTKAGQEFQPVNISKVMITTVAPMEIKIITMSAVMAVAAGTALPNKNLCNLMITTPLLVLITLISIIMILIDIMRARIRGTDKNPIARDMAI